MKVRLLTAISTIAVILAVPAFAETQANSNASAKTGVSADIQKGWENTALVMSPNRVLSREHLFDLTRDGKFDAYDRAVDIQIARIRKKLGDDPKSSELIKTIRGVGYMFCGETEAEG